MAEFTLLKLELEEGSLTANAPFSGRDRDDEPTDEDGGGGSRVLPLVAGLVFLVVLSLVVRKLRSGSGDLDDEIETDAETPL